MIVTSKIPSAISDLCLLATLEKTHVLSLSTKCFLWQLQPLGFFFYYYLIFFSEALTFQIYENDPLTGGITDFLQLKAINLQAEPSGGKSSLITQHSAEKNDGACADVRHHQTPSTYIFLSQTNISFKIGFALKS